MKTCLLRKLKWTNIRAERLLAERDAARGRADSERGLLLRAREDEQHERPAVDAAQGEHVAQRLRLL